MNSFRSLLFVPASRPERFAKALGSGADCVCLDLEDSVAAADKTKARETVSLMLPKLRERCTLPIGVRINAVGSEDWQQDLAAVCPLACLIMVPKVCSAAELGSVAALVSGNTKLWPLVESADGLHNCWEIAAAARVGGVLFGAFDYAADVGCALSWEALLFARSQLVAACAAARIELLDSPSGDFSDTAGLIETSHRVKALGFSGRACIHPTQVASVNEVFSSSAPEVEQARRVLAAYEASGGAAAQLDGKLIELPVALAARRVVTRARN
jgi:citrate lyase beta subunit